MALIVYMQQPIKSGNIKEIQKLNQFGCNAVIVEDFHGKVEKPALQIILKRHILGGHAYFFNLSAYNRSFAAKLVSPETARQYPIASCHFVLTSGGTRCHLGTSKQH